MMKPDRNYHINEWKVVSIADLFLMPKEEEAQKQQKDTILFRDPPKKPTTKPAPKKRPLKRKPKRRPTPKGRQLKRRSSRKEIPPHRQLKRKPLDMEKIRREAAGILAPAPQPQPKLRPPQPICGPSRMSILRSM